MTSTNVGVDPASRSTDIEAGLMEVSVDRHARRWFWLVFVIAVLGVLGTGVRAAVNGWQPIGDSGYFAVRAHDVLSGHPPLLGTASSASSYSGTPLNHPGPLQFNLLALPVWLFGTVGGVAIGTAAINAACVAGVGLMVRRWAGSLAGCLALFGMATLTWSIGGQVLHDPWGPFAVVLPFALLIVAASVAASGEPWALPVVTVAASLVLQTHLSYVLLVPALLLVAVVGVVLGSRARRRSDPEGWPTHRRAVRRWGAIAAVAALVCWLQPLYAEVSRDPANMAGLIAASGEENPVGVTINGAVVALAQTVALPPLWFTPSFRTPDLLTDQVSLGVAAAVSYVALAVLAAGLGAVVVLARRRGDRVVLGAGVASLVGLVVGLLTVVRSPAYGVLGFTYIRWVWPLSMWVWVTLVLAVVRLGGVRMRSFARSRIAVAAIAVASVVAGVLAYPGTDNTRSEQHRWQKVADPAMDAVLAEVGDEHPVLIKHLENHATYALAPALMARLTDEGVPFVVDHVLTARQVGEHRMVWNHLAPVTVVFGFDEEDVPPGGELIFKSRGLERHERASLAEIQRAIRRAIDSKESIQLTDEFRTALNQSEPELLAAFDESVATGRLDVEMVTYLYTAPAFAYDEPRIVADPDLLSAEQIEEFAHLGPLAGMHRAAIFVVHGTAGEPPS